MISLDHHQPIVRLIDGVSAATLVATLATWLPIVMSVPAGIWYCVLLYDWWTKRKVGKDD